MSSIQTFHDNLIRLQPIDLLAYQEVIPEFQIMNSCTQEPKYHLEGSVLVHAQMAMTEVLKLLDQIETQEDKVALYIATMLHDIGKKATWAISPKHGRITAYGHDKVGVPIANDFLKKYFPKIGYITKNKILSLIENHMKLREFMKNGVRDIKLKKLSLETDVKLLYLLSMADTLGRKAENMNGCELLERFKSECQRLNIWENYFVIPNSEYLNNHAYTLARWDILINGKLETKETMDKAQELSKKFPQFQLLILCGVPASGKTQWRNNLVRQFSDVKVISMDDKRTELLGNVNDQSQNQAMFRICTSELVETMKKRKSAIWDNTSASRAHRKVIIDIARRYGALVGIVYFDLSLETLLERNKNREKKIPDSIIEEYYYKRMERPVNYEADKITVVEK